MPFVERQIKLAQWASNCTGNCYLPNQSLTQYYQSSPATLRDLLKTMYKCVSFCLFLDIKLFKLPPEVGYVIQKLSSYAVAKIDIGRA